MTMPKKKKNSSANLDMATNDTSVSKETTRELTASFLKVLENDDVVAKLAEAMSTSFQLLLDEKTDHINKKLDKIINDNKLVLDRITEIERDNDKLKHLNASLQSEISDLKTVVNQLEQGARKNIILISGIKESYAESAIEGGTTDEPPQDQREDTVKTVCSVIKEACNLDLTSTDIQVAYRLKAKRNSIQPRPLLVTFHSSATRDAVFKARQPKQTLTYRGSNIYFNEYMTATNSSLFYKARNLVKTDSAHSTWIKDGKIFVKWSERGRPVQIKTLADLDDEL